MYPDEDLILLSKCTLCPRECYADRFYGSEGYCNSDAGLNIATVCIHRGEEPVIGGTIGICNIFFGGCNLRCAFCQNHEISRPGSSILRSSYTLEDALEKIENILSTGIKAIGFVSPSHVVPQVKTIIRGLHKRGLKPIMVYNTNGYDKAEVIDSLDGLIDVYLPDYKYVTPALALELSDASDYPEVVLKALRRMYYQKGSRLLVDDEGMAENGILIRHLVLPGHSEESIKVLRSIAEEFSPGINVSLMSQYHPNQFVKNRKDLGRSLYRSEYEKVALEMEKLGFRNGWLQDMDSNENYRPDFFSENPFE